MNRDTPSPSARTQDVKPAKTGWRAPRWLTLCAIWSLIPLIAIMAGGDTVHAQSFNFDQSVYFYEVRKDHLSRNEQKA